MQGMNNIKLLSFPWCLDFLWFPNSMNLSVVPEQLPVTSSMLAFYS